jgi:hypothetical protein
LVPFEADYMDVSELPFIQGMVFGTEDNECYACGCGMLDVVGDMDGAIVIECRGCGAQMRAIEKAKPPERAQSLRSLLID